MISKQVSTMLIPENLQDLVSTSSVPFSMLVQRFTCVRLPHSHMTQSSRAF